MKSLENFKSLEFYAVSDELMRVVKSGVFDIELDQLNPEVRKSNKIFKTLM